MKKKETERRFPWSLQQVVMTITAVVAIFGTGIRLDSHSAQKQHNLFVHNATNAPNLKSLMIADSTKEASGILLQNTGLGPMTIKDVQIFRRDAHQLENTSFALQGSSQQRYQKSHREPCISLSHQGL